MLAKGSLEHHVNFSALYLHEFTVGICTAMTVCWFALTNYAQTTPTCIHYCI